MSHNIPSGFFQRRIIAKFVIFSIAIVRPSKGSPVRLNFLPRDAFLHLSFQVLAGSIRGNMSSGKSVYTSYWAAARRVTPNIVATLLSSQYGRIKVRTEQCSSPIMKFVGRFGRGTFIQRVI
jgi:peptidoglycan/LPS O-acetylase OafA/YrhL